MTDYTKLWFQRAEQRAATARAREQIQLTGKGLPCSVASVIGTGGIVEVKFEISGGPPLQNIVLPKAGTEWIRYPTQVGDRGMTVPADFYLGGVSGLGGGTANFSQRGNLTALVFLPIGNVGWSSVNLNQVTLYGPGGVLARDQGNTASVNVVQNEVTITATDSITLIAGGKTVTLNSAGLTIDGILFDTHEHTATQPGTGKSGGPISA